MMSFSQTFAIATSVLLAMLAIGCESQLHRADAAIGVDSVHADTAEEDASELQDVVPLHDASPLVDVGDGVDSTGTDEDGRDAIGQPSDSTPSDGFLGVGDVESPSFEEELESLVVSWGDEDGFPVPGVTCPFSGAEGVKLGAVVPNSVFALCDGSPIGIGTQQCGAVASLVILRPVWAPSAYLVELNYYIETFFPFGVRFFVVTYEDFLGGKADQSSCLQSRQDIAEDGDNVIWAFDDAEVVSDSWLDSDHGSPQQWLILGAQGTVRARGDALDFDLVGGWLVDAVAEFALTLH